MIHASADLRKSFIGAQHLRLEIYLHVEKVLQDVVEALITFLDEIIKTHNEGTPGNVKDL